jgi:hypothetical protein
LPGRVSRHWGNRCPGFLTISNVVEKNLIHGRL